MILLTNADAARIPLHDQSVQCVVTSPLAIPSFCGILSLSTINERAFCVHILWPKGRCFCGITKAHRARVDGRHTGAAAFTLLYGGTMERDELGRFVKGHRYSPATEFKPGEHWRKRKPYWDREWLFNEYRLRGRSAREIAEDFDITENAILYWLDKLNIPTRTVSEVRQMKHWGASGKDNPMYGVRGEDHPRWKGGVTPERQAFYRSEEWHKASRIVRRRNRGCCHRCGRREPDETYTGFHIHHIVPFAESEELRADPDNLVLLCPDCHHWVHSNDNEAGKYLKGGD